MVRKLTNGNLLPKTIVHRGKKYSYAVYNPLAFWELEKAKDHKKSVEHFHPEMECVVIPYITGIKTNPKVWGVYMRRK